MLWVLIFGGIALAGLGMVVAYGVWLTHKTSDLLAEVRVLGDRAGQISDALAEIAVPPQLVEEEAAYAGSTVLDEFTEHDEAGGHDDGVR